MPRQKWIIRVLIEVRDPDLAKLILHELVDTTMRDPASKFDISQEFVNEEER